MLAIRKEYTISFVDQIVLWADRVFTGEDEVSMKEIRNNLEK
jgi:hypothetical protein